jgi:hypothetical protein
MWTVHGQRLLMFCYAVPHNLLKVSLQHVSVKALGKEAQRHRILYCASAD